MGRIPKTMIPWPEGKDIEKMVLVRNDVYHACTFILQVLCRYTMTIHHHGKLHMSAFFAARQESNRPSPWRCRCAAVKRHCGPFRVRCVFFFFSSRYRTVLEAFDSSCGGPCPPPPPTTITSYRLQTLTGESAKNRRDSIYRCIIIVWFSFD